MQQRLKREVREFYGEMPKNKSIVSRIRDNGYYGVMLNKDDFMDAVVWSANIVYEYKDYFASHKHRIVIPLTELPFLKEDLVNAHFIMIVYYGMKYNFILVEELKLSLYTVARFQKIAEEDIASIERWDKHALQCNELNTSNDPTNLESGVFRGGEKTCEKYSHLVTQEIEKYRGELLKLKV
ncbi:MAG: hypothetical protein LBQ58_08485 [Synergistaceae bacterium]|nr:hypothetical protein [Synergistaceae bacterium]